jgi:3-(3-hydroxy-phenyl)propionate hydroxylase
LGQKFVGLTQTADKVVVAAENAGAPVEFAAHWVVGADGGRSAVRKAVGLTMDGFTWPQRVVVTNIYYDFERYGWNSGYLIDPAYGAVVYKINLVGLWRFPFAEQATQPLEKFKERILQFIRTVLPGDQKYELAPYRLQHASADRGHLSPRTRRSRR